MKIAAKIGLAFLIVAIAVNIATALIFYPAAQGSLRNAIYAHLATTVESRKEHIQTYLAMLELGVEQMSKSIVLENLIKADKTGIGRREALELAVSRLKRTDEANPFIDEFLLIDADGKVIASSEEQSIGRDMSSDVLFLGAQKSAYIKDIYVSGELKKSIIGVSAPVLDSQTNEFIGVIAAREDLVELYRILTERSGLGSSGEIYLVNKYGYMISPSRFKKDTFLRQVIDVPAFRSIHYPGPTAGKAFVYRNYRGVEVLGIHEYIPQMQWMLFAEMDTNEAFAPLARMREQFTIALLLAAIAALMIGRAIAVIITSPIRKLYKGMEIIGAGNLDYKVGTVSKDEIGELSRSFDEMSDHLKVTTTSVDSLYKEIAERKKAEAEARRLAQVVESSDDAVIGKDLDGTIFSWNKGAQKIYGWLPEEVIGKNISILAPPGRQEEILNILDRIREGKTVEHLDTVRITKDGRKVDLSLTISAIRDDSGKLIGASTIARDITVEKKMEKELARALAEWERTFNSITDLIFILDKDYNILKVNDACCKAFKLKREEIIGRKCYQLVHNLDHPWPECPHARVLRDHAATEEEVDDPNVGVPLLVAVSPIFDNRGEFIGSVHIARDISESKKVENALKEAVEIKTNFTSTVSHELRTPLAAIKEGISIVLDGSAGAIGKDQAEFLSIAKRNVDRLGRLINDILDFQKLESGKMTFKMQAGNINKTAREARDTMTAIAQQKKLDILLDLSEDLPEARFDRDRIAQVLTNLVNNAIKFTEKGNITIRTARDGDFVKVSVQDTGIGMKEEDVPLLFEKFKQLDTGMGRKTGGTGLGLSISKEIIQKHGGKMSVESRLGTGSTFSFTLPVF